MNQWAFIIAAYAVVLGGTLGITIWSLIGLKRVEKKLEALRSGGRPDKGDASQVETGDRIEGAQS